VQAAVLCLGIEVRMVPAEATARLCELGG